MIWLGVAAAAVLVIIIVAVSGGDDETTDTTAAATTTAAPTTEAPETTEAPSDTTEAPSDKTEAPAETTTTAAAAAPIRIAIVAPSASNDLAFTQSIVDGVNAIAAEREIAEIAITDGTFVVDDAAAAIRDYAANGFDLGVAHGSQYGGSLQEIAPDFPETSFAWGTAADTFGLPNVFAYEAASDEGGFVMGVIGAALTESGTIGIVGPIEVGDAKLYVDGFKAGAEANDSGVTVNINYTGSFSDVALASEAAQAHAAAGADVMSGTAQMVVGAISVAADQNILWFGTQANQATLAPEIVVASQVYKWEVVLSDILDKVAGGTLGGSSYVIDLENGGLVLEFNEDFTLSDDVKALADQTVADIISGAIVPTE